MSKLRGLSYLYRILSHLLKLFLLLLFHNLMFTVLVSVSESHSIAVVISVK